uniref:Uncharacterized protein n=1 Tax=Nelumbo nucifera TaxID=4432 RepID=A0A822XWT6_NELNU|nr:TPA_asm: hypothetical protein HUJ06_027572 [Nelumbo nucifera]
MAKIYFILLDMGHMVIEGRASCCGYHEGILNPSFYPASKHLCENDKSQMEPFFCIRKRLYFLFLISYN